MNFETVRSQVLSVILTCFICALGGQSVLAQTTQTFSYTGPAIAIPDGADLSGTLPGAPVSAPLVVSGLPGRITDVNIRIDGTVCNATASSTTVGVDHSFINDLVFTLTSPNGTGVTIINHTDGGGNNLCQTLLDDQSTGGSIQAVVTAQAPFTGSFTPNAPLSAYYNQNPNGTWALTAQDFFSQDTGSIRAFSLIITSQVTTAASASISGRVLAGGKGVANARVEITGTGGAVRTVITNPFGNFTISEVESGATYVVNVSAKRYSFASQVVSVTDNVSDLIFTAQ